MSATTDLPGTLGVGYAGADEHRPLAGYALLSGGFVAGLAGGLLTARDLPQDIAARDIVLAGVATHKLSRLITKDKVTGFLRAPFTRFQEPSGHGEVEEAPRGRGLRYAAGELLVCPYCVGLWVAGTFVLGYVHAPRLTRLIAALLTVHGVSDALQLAYKAAEERS
jgi:hypothetical protein